MLSVIEREDRARYIVAVLLEELTAQKALNLIVRISGQLPLNGDQYAKDIADRVTTKLALERRIQKKVSPSL